MAPHRFICNSGVQLIILKLFSKVLDDSSNQCNRIDRKVLSLVLFSDEFLLFFFHGGDS